MAKTTPLNISYEHRVNLETALTDLNVARTLLNGYSVNEGNEEALAVAALIERAGAKFEQTLLAVGILEGPGIIGDAAQWLGIRARGNEEVEP